MAQKNDLSQPPAQLLNTKARFAGDDTVNKVLRNDFIEIVNVHHLAFGAVIYLPVEVDDTAFDDQLEKPLFSRLDDNQKALRYALPKAVKVLANPEEHIPQLTQNAEGVATNPELTMSLMIGYPTVPVGAIVEWLEETQNGKHRRVWWYVHSITAKGTTGAFVIHDLVPCADFEQAISGGLVSA
uniref:Uncharacterized protein n=2 Tax=Vibrio TaxID=662 RepID=A0A0H3ZU95_9VIBR|nr:hypothetical protein [Vibrio cyclitrophicus]AKN38185.1 hypothetical protein [Vibrio splendidus]